MKIRGRDMSSEFYRGHNHRPSVGPSSQPPTEKRAAASRWKPPAGDKEVKRERFHRPTRIQPGADLTLRRFRSREPHGPPAGDKRKRSIRRPTRYLNGEGFQPATAPCVEITILDPCLKPLV